MGRGRSNRIVAVAWAVVGLLAGHAIAYHAVYLDAHVHADALTCSGHGWLWIAAPGAFVALGAALVVGLVGPRRGHHAVARFGTLARIQVGAFVSVEVGERLAAGMDGPALAHELIEHGFWLVLVVGIVVQLIAARLGAMASVTIASLAAPAPARHLPRPRPLAATHTDDRPSIGTAVAFWLARAPPPSGSARLNIPITSPVTQVNGTSPHGVHHMPVVLHSRRASARTTTALLGALVATAATVMPAVGHISIPEGEVASGSSSVIHLRVPHGCEGASTDTLEVQVPDGVVSAQPEYVPGWTVEVEMVESEPYERFGETLTERVGIIRWRGGELPDSAYHDFGIRATFLAEPGTTLAFPTVQRCGDAESAWIEPVVEGQPEPEHPTPTVAVGEAAGG